MYRSYILIGSVWFPPFSSGSPCGWALKHFLLLNGAVADFVEFSSHFPRISDFRWILVGLLRNFFGFSIFVGFYLDFLAYVPRILMDIRWILVGLRMKRTKGSVVGWAGCSVPS